MRNIIPSPFDKDSSLTNLSKKAEVLVEGFRISRIILNIIILLIIGFLAIQLFGLPSKIVGIIIGYEILLSTVFAFIRYSKINELNRLKNCNLKEIHLTNEYYNLISLSVGFISHLIIAISILIIYNDILIKYSNIYLKYLIFAFVLVKGLDFLIQYVKYKIVKELNPNKSLAQINQDLYLLKSKIGLFKNIPSAIVIFLVMYYFGLPINIILIFIVAYFAIEIINIISILRVSSVNLSKEYALKNKIYDINKNKHYKNEKVIGVIYGIMNQARKGYEILGKGKTTKPENTLVLTDKRIILAQVFVTGGNNMLGGAIYADANFFFNRGEIRREGEKILKKGLNTFLNSVPYAFDIEYEDLERISLYKMIIKIKTKNKGEFSYLFMDREYIANVQKWFKVFGKKFIIE